MISTERFLLRPLTLEDVTARYSRWFDDGVAQKTIESAAGPHGIDDLKAYLAVRLKRKDVLFLGIFAREGGEHIGNVKFEPIDLKQGFAVMGILIGEREWRGRGVAGEVLRATSRYLRERLGLRELVLGVKKDNVPAIKAYEKVGFRVQKTDWIKSDPETSVTMVYDLQSRAHGGTKRTVLSRSHAALADIFSKSESWADGAVGACGRYSGEAVRRRLLQAVLFESAPGFISQAANIDFFLEDAQKGELRCGGWSIDGSNGALRPRPVTILRHLASFAVHWFFVLGAYVAALLHRPVGKEGGKTTLIFGVPPDAIRAEGSDRAFVEFCEKGPIEPLRGSPWNIVQLHDDRGLEKTLDFAYVKRPLTALFVQGGAPGISVLLEHIRSARAFLAGVIRRPALCALGRDFAYHALAWDLDRKDSIGAVVLTVSEHHRQSLWMNDLPGRRFSTHMVWYSDNNQPHVYRDEPVISFVPQFRYMRYDQNWVWSEKNARYLKDLVKSPIPSKVVGPIIWRLPRKSERVEDGVVRIGVFDVSPLDPGWARENGYPDSYYSPETTTKFLKDVLEVCRAFEKDALTPVRLLLKQKRSFSPIHDKDYIRYVEGVIGREGGFEHVEHDTNLFEFVSRLDIVIVIPFSSPAFVAEALGVPAIFYDPTDSLSDDLDGNASVRFAGGREALSSGLKEALAARA